MSTGRRHFPPERTLRWAAQSVGRGSRIVSIRALPQGGWNANHALTIVDRRGTAHRLVLRRWARTGWEVDDPDFTAAREAAVLELLSGSPVRAPRLVAADPESETCDVPTLLITRLRGRPPGLPSDLGAFLAQLAEALPAIHAVDGRAYELVPAYRRYHELHSLTPPRWLRRRQLWERALELAQSEPPAGPRCFIHRDYHPENTLWLRGRLAGIVDWTSASWGPAAVDTGHMRWNLALTYGVDAAEEFLRVHRASSGPLADQRHWDVVTLLDLVYDLDPRDWPAFDLARMERYLASVLG